MTMALDKQKILNELGNVVNQLQSADCGCMGKIFSNSGQTNPNLGSMPNEYSGGMRNCCGHHGHHGHHGFSAPYAGEPYSGAHHCMGSCNPPKLYADTYSYLNKNMMQPVVQEVYNDLKSISPNNTVMNNPMVAQMGLSQASNPNQGNTMAQHAMPGVSAGNPNHNHHTHMPHLHFGNTQMSSEPVMDQGGINQTAPGMGQMGLDMGQGMAQMGQSGGTMVQGMSQTRQGMGQMRQCMGHTGEIMVGMGPQIVNMISSTGKQMPNQGNPSINTTGNNISKSPEIGQLMSNVTGDVKDHFNSGQIQNNVAYMGMNKMPTDNNAMSNTPHMPNTPSNYYNTNQQQIGNTIPSPQKRTSSNPYGQHTAGITKFNEMFPGVMKTDLGFDPMAIAIQMNPANQQRSAMDTMQKMMSNSGGMSKIIESPGMQPVVNTTNAVTTSLSHPNQQLTGQSPDQQNIQQQQQRANADTIQSNQIPQNVYTAVSGAAVMNQQPSLAQSSAPTEQIHNQQMVGSLPVVYENSELASTQQKHVSEHLTLPTSAQHIYKEPIFPADTSRNLLQSHHFMKAPLYDYNTIGQPVQMISPENYHTLEPDLPQTISGQVVPTKTTIDPMKFSDVKATVSKTALVGNRPIGKTPSRSQLHHLYNQYKGSQSFTQSNIRPSGFTSSNSEGRINVPEGKAIPQQFIERVGGDTIANNEVRPVTTKPEENINHIGDVPINTKQLDDSPTIRARNGKTRNGLQDQVFSSYPTSAKWSFHGTTPAPYSVGYRFRSK